MNDVVKVSKEMYVFLKLYELDTYENKVTAIADAKQTLHLIHEEEFKTLMEAVLKNSFITDTGYIYINIAEPDNVNNKRQEERFVKLTEFLDPQTKAKSVQLDLVEFSDATKFTKEMLENFPSIYRVYTAPSFLLDEVDAVFKYGDFEEWSKEILEEDNNLPDNSNSEGESSKPLTTAQAQKIVLNTREKFEKQSQKKPESTLKKKATLKVK
ncbi:TPA: hypothetical protein VAX93_001385 [Streptococcus agalactiae]|nr:hypothetical protein [Streptococcus agalactiae]